MRSASLVYRDHKIQNIVLIHIQSLTTYHYVRVLEAEHGSPGLAQVFIHMLPSRGFKIGSLNLKHGTLSTLRCCVMRIHVLDARGNRVSRRVRNLLLRGYIKLFEECILLIFCGRATGFSSRFRQSHNNRIPFIRTRITHPPGGLGFAIGLYHISILLLNFSQSNTARG